jgi:hypothetical protein
VRHGRVGRVASLLALPAILAQILIAAPHATERVIAMQAAARGVGTAATIVSDAGRQTRGHDSTECPACQAAAQGRTALGAAASAWALPLPPALDLIARASADLPATLARSTAAPRAPPV